MPIHDITDTALITAFARDLETRRDDALFKDAYAQSLAGERGARLAREAPGFEKIANSVACRTALFDELISKTIDKEGIDLVLNLAAGLDTRPFRLRLPPSLRWVDVDRASVLRHKRERIAGAPPVCQYEQCAADLTMPAELDRALKVARHSKRALVVTEGLLVYLSVDEVTRLARALRDVTAIGCWVTDLAGPRALAMMKSAWGTLLVGAEFRFGPADPVGFFASHGWQEVEFRSSQSVAQEFGRAPKPGVIGRIVGQLLSSRIKEEIRRLSGVALLVRTEDNRREEHG